MLIKGNQADFIKSGNTLSGDAFSGHTFDYILSNPPFGREWKNEKTAVEQDAKDVDGRFGPGLPSISDSQMLFLLTAVSKLKPNGRAAIIQNGSPLFTGDAGSGPSEIRRYILENDLLEAIVALPNDIFYNTGIATYIWVLCKGKPENRKGKVLLINANGMFEKRRKSLGNKRNDIPQSAIDRITRLYADFVESPVSKIFDVQDFGYTKITIERPAEDSETEDHAAAGASTSGTQQLSLAPDKDSTFVLDFVNTQEEIKEAFDPYYAYTFLQEGTDPNIIYQIRTNLEDCRIFTGNDFEKFKNVLAGKGKIESKLAAAVNVLQPIVQVYCAREELERSAFKTGLARFNRIYNFVTQISRMFDEDMYLFSIFTKKLSSMLP